MNSKRKIAIAASALAAFTSIVLITNQASASNSAPVTTPTVTSQPSIAGSTSDTNGVDVQSGDQNSPDVAGAASESATEAAGDPAGGASDPNGVDVQSGDQTTPDVAGATSETDSATSDPAGGVDVQSGAQSGDQTTVDVAGATDAGSSN